MTLEQFLKNLNQTPQAITFEATLAVIENNYTFTPTAFENGVHHNAAGENNGSCKLLAFAEMQNLSKEQTLCCFGAYYHQDVLKNPEGNNHQNIRNFMKTAWDGIAFYGTALEIK